MEEVRIISTAKVPLKHDSPTSFLEVLAGWNCSWMWRKMKITGGTAWMYDAIADKSLIGVTDGSFIQDFCPTICSAAVVLECTKGRGRLVLSFAEQSPTASAFHGELLGLLALHLLLLSFNKVRPQLTGCVMIYSDCLGALNRVKHLPTHKITTSCRHADILKVISLHCLGLSFQRKFAHVKAHQDEDIAWDKHSRPSQRNCGCDAAAKRDIITQDLH